VVRRSQSEKYLEAKLAELETAKAELAGKTRARRQSRDAGIRTGRFQSSNFAPDGYVVTNLKGHIQDANVAACRLLSRDQQSLMGFPSPSFCSG
jgi:PAS domain-containing protein